MIAVETKARKIDGELSDTRIASGGKQRSVP